MRHACLAKALVLLLALAGPAKADLIGYITGPGDPWGVGPGNPASNDAALDRAFGPGAWQKLTFTNAVGAGIFTSGYKLLFIDGGDGNSGSFDSFINANRTALQNYVAGGGRLFVNAARWGGGPLDLGFGATLSTNFFSPTGYVVDPSSPFVKGPNGPAGTSWTGNFFSHDYITGSGLTPLITSAPGGGGKVLLADEGWGKGLVLLGGMTLPYWQAPLTEAENLRANLLDFAAGEAVAAGFLPEPSGLALLGLGAISLLDCLRRRLRRPGVVE
jgi:hypothetical protein